MVTASADAVIGREVELDIVTQFLAAMTVDGPAALMMRGEAGIGKTTIWHAAVQNARHAGLTVMSCRPGSAEAELPFAGLGDLFADVSDDVLDRLTTPQRQALDVALLRVDARTSPLQQRAVSTAALNTLTDVARSAPVLLAIDDLQWLDLPSVRVLRFVMRRLAPSPVGVLVASRSDGVDDPLDLADALPAERVKRLIVGPLSLSEIDYLLPRAAAHRLLGPDAPADP